MARKLTFLLDDTPIEVALFKLDRDKLYGKKETLAIDHGDRPLAKGYLDEWGSVVIGVTGMGYLDADNNWQSRNDLVITASELRFCFFWPYRFPHPGDLVVADPAPSGGA